MSDARIPGTRFRPAGPDRLGFQAMLGVFLDRDTVDAGDMDLSPLDDVVSEWDYYGHTGSHQLQELSLIHI